MGWYLKKAFRFGPIRFNLSKSGIGVSGGIKGLRVGTGPRGTYVHAGRGGIYYRKSFRGAERDPTLTSAGPAEDTPAGSPPQRRADCRPILVFVSVIVVILLAYVGMSETVVVTSASALFVICVVVAVMERTMKARKPPQRPLDDAGGMQKMSEFPPDDRK
jgi:hypothetical protein